MVPPSDSSTPVEPADLLAHGSFVRALTRALVHHDHDAEDVAQETALAALRSPPRPGPIRAWLRAVARNAARRLGRTRARRSARERIAARGERTEPDVSSETAETLALLGRAIAALPADLRGAVLLRWFHGRSVAEVARLQGTPVETARTRLRRALERLRAELGAGPARERRLRSLAALAGAGAWKGGVLVGTAAKVGIGTVALAATAAVGWLVVHPESPADPEPVSVRVEEPASEPPPLAGTGRSGPAGGARLGAGAGDERDVRGPLPQDPLAVRHGRLVGPDGVGLGGVVYLVEKGKPASDSPPSVITGADGSFAWGRSLEGQWVGALTADGSALPAWLDGDALPDPIVLALRAGHEVVATARADDGTVPEGIVVRWETAPDVGASLFPGPEDRRRGEGRAALGPSGEARLSVGTDAPILVRAGSEDWYAEPRTVRLEHAEGRVAFRLLRRCDLSLRMLDASTGKPVRTNVSVAVVETPEGVRTRQGSWPDQDGVVWVVPSLAPGAYRVRVDAVGYRLWDSDEIRFTTPGEEREVEVRLLADLEAGSLRIELPEPVRPPEADGRIAWCVVVRSAGGRWGSVPARWSSADPRALVVDSLPRATYDVLVWPRPLALVGGARGVGVGGGRAARADVVLEPGLEIPLDAPPSDAPGSGTRTRDVRVEGALFGDLPLVGFVPGGYTVYDGPVPAGTRLGPYPPLGLLLHEKRSDGTEAVRSIVR